MQRDASAYRSRCIWNVGMVCIPLWGSVRMVALGVCEAVEWAMVIACSMARRMHS
jgi:hypothetical protein